MRSRVSPFLLLAIPVVILFAVLAYNFPPIHERLAWRIDNLQAKIKYALNPPEEVVFVPQKEVEPLVQELLKTLMPTATSSPTVTATETAPGPTNSPQPTPTITPTPTPLPTAMTLQGVIHEYQKWNNCGPATLAMALSFWGWQGDQLNTAAYMKPNERDKNVMPYEMEDYIETNTSLQAIVRVGGDLGLLKRFIAAGFPVVIEKGFDVSGEGWMGHYGVLTGYDDTRSRFIAQDSYIQADLPVPYAELERYWRHFNFIYLVIYPPEREGEVLAMLGMQADETTNYQTAAQRASDEIFGLAGRDLYFAWFNRGSSLMRLQDYAGAAAAYDEAFAVYPSIPVEERPWRNLWYQTGPYFAYFYTGRYYDVLDLATKTLTAVDEPAIEESYYWRGMAKAALGDSTGAIEDFQESLKWHPDFEPSVYQLNLMGVTP